MFRNTYASGFTLDISVMPSVCKLLLSPMAVDLAGWKFVMIWLLFSEISETLLQSFMNNLVKMLISVNFSHLKEHCAFRLKSFTSGTSLQIHSSVLERYQNIIQTILFKHMCKIIVWFFFLDCFSCFDWAYKTGEKITQADIKYMTWHKMDWQKITVNIYVASMRTAYLETDAKLLSMIYSCL